MSTTGRREGRTRGARKIRVRLDDGTLIEADELARDEATGEAVLLRRRPISLRQAVRRARARRSKPEPEPRSEPESRDVRVAAVPLPEPCGWCDSGAVETCAVHGPAARREPQWKVEARARAEARRAEAAEREAASRSPEAVAERERQREDARAREADRRRARGRANRRQRVERDRRRAERQARPEPSMPEVHVEAGCAVCGVGEPDDPRAARLQRSRFAVPIAGRGSLWVVGPRCRRCYAGVERHEFVVWAWIGAELGREAVMGDLFAWHVEDGRRRGLPDAVPNAVPFGHVEDRRSGAGGRAVLSGRSAQAPEGA